MDKKTYRKEYREIYIETCKARKCKITTNNWEVNRQTKQVRRHWKIEIYRIPEFQVDRRRILMFLK